MKIGVNKLKNYDDEVVYIEGIGGYFLDSLSNNTLDISEIDTINHIIKGTFKFKAISRDKSNTVEISDGEFDIKINFWRPRPHYYFKCTLNGEEWSIDQYSLSQPGALGNYNKEYKSFSIRAGRYIDSKNENKFQFIFNFNLQKGKIYFDNFGEYVYWKKENSSQYQYFYLDSTFNNIINITKVDTAKKYITGNVELRAICDKCPSKDTVRLTNGYFDVKY